MEVMTLKLCIMHNNALAVRLGEDKWGASLYFNVSINCCFVVAVFMLFLLGYLPTFKHAIHNFWILKDDACCKKKLYLQ